MFEFLVVMGLVLNFVGLVCLGYGFDAVNRNLEKIINRIDYLDDTVRHKK